VNRLEEARLAPFPALQVRGDPARLRAFFDTADAAGAELAYFGREDAGPA
jgi:hypothetical protein